MVKILKYIFSIIFLIAFSCNAQDQIRTKKHLKFGLDMSSLVISAYDSDRTSFGFSLDFEIKEKIFTVFEAGFENTKVKNNRLEYGSNGNYFKLGCDYNFFKNKYPGDNEILFIGFRYAFGLLNHKADKYIIYDNYWGNYESSFPSSSLNVHWFEIVAGLKTEVFENLYIGWDVRAKVKMFTNDDASMMDPWLISGYGKGSKKMNFGFTYSIFYGIPFKIKHIKKNKPITK